MSKNFILTKEDLQNLIHESITFFSDKSKEAMQKNKTIMFSDRTRWIEEFLNKFLQEVPIDSVLDEVDKKLLSFKGRGIHDIKNDLALKQPKAAKEMNAIKAYLSEMEKNDN